jgi:hypothetical protein
LFNTISGKEGFIRIEEIGATIGVFSAWRLDRERKNEERYAETFRFNGTLKYINQALFEDDDYSPVVTINFRRDRHTKKVKQYRLDRSDGSAIELKGRSLLLTGVTPCLLED